MSFNIAKLKQIMNVTIVIRILYKLSFISYYLQLLIKNTKSIRMEAFNVEVSTNKFDELLLKYYFFP